MIFLLFGEIFPDYQIAMLLCRWYLLESLHYPHILLKLIIISLLFLQRGHIEHNGFTVRLVSSALHYLLLFQDLRHHMWELTPEKTRGTGH